MPIPWRPNFYWVVGFLILVVLLALVYRYVRASSGTSHSPAGPPGLPFGVGEKSFPYRHLEMPPTTDMFSALRNERPRIRHDETGEKPHRVMIYRNKGDREKSDGIADHYTEQLRVTQIPPGSTLSSLWDTWATKAHREFVVKYAKNPRSILSLRRKLEEIAPAIYDTNPMFVRVILELAAKELGIPSYQLMVVDLCVGWGGQALGACAADVGCYHGYLIPSMPVNPIHEYLAPKIQDALSETSNPQCNPGEFWVRQMHPAITKNAYAVLLFHVSNLEVCSFAWDMICPGGWIVMFVPTDRKSHDRALLALELTRDWPEPQLYGVRERFNGQWQTPGALIWKKPRKKAGKSKMKRREE